MSTRATYLFLADEEDFAPATTFYIHHDGYPEGAADYFAAAQEYRRVNGGANAATVFFRANPRAELTRDHEAHWDTEYRYTFDPATDTLVAEEGDFGGWDIDGERLTVFAPFFEGSVDEFIGQYQTKKTPA